MATRGLPNWPWAGIPPEDLPGPEALALDAARAWVEATRSGAAPLVAARLVLATEGLAGSAPALDALLRALACPGGMGCRLCPRVTAAEAALLSALALAQRGPRREALAILMRIASPADAYAAMGPALAMGLHFRRAGFLLAQPLRAAG